MASSLVDYGDSDDEAAQSRDATFVSPHQKNCFYKNNSSSECSLNLSSPCGTASTCHPRLQSASLFSQPYADSSGGISLPLASVERHKPSPIRISEEKSHEEVLSALRASIDKLLHLRSRGRTINQYMQESSQFQNPYCLEKIMETCNISPYCSNFPESLYDPVQLGIWESSRFKRFLREAQKGPSSASFRSHSKDMSPPSSALKESALAAAGATTAELTQALCSDAPQAKNFEAAEASAQNATTGLAKKRRATNWDSVGHRPNDLSQAVNSTKSTDKRKLISLTEQRNRRSRWE